MVTLIVKSLKAFAVLPTEIQNSLLTKSFIRQDPYDPQNEAPVKRTVYSEVKTSFYCGLGIKYHRTRIEGGHEFLREPLDEQEFDLLDALDNSLNRPEFVYMFGLKSGQMLLVNNNFICHDRLPFHDNEKSRLLERYWAGMAFD